MKLLDIFCGAGGAAMGYYRAGFTDITGIDIKPQKHYPFKFIQADALEYLAEHGHEYDVIHASPPCQAYSVMTNGRWKDRVKDHPDLIAKTRKLLLETRKPYIIENVVGAPLINPVMLCGTMFGLQTINENQLRRHRLFETSFDVGPTPSCQHNTVSAIGVYGHSGGSSNRDGIKFFGLDARRQTMEINWMTGAELSQAIPPAYTEWIGKQLMKILCN